MVHEIFWMVMHMKKEHEEETTKKTHTKTTHTKKQRDRERKKAEEQNEKGRKEMKEVDHTLRVVQYRGNREFRKSVWQAAQSTRTRPDPRPRTPSRKISLISCLPVGRLSDIKLIRTDTTLDHSQ